MSRFRSTFVMVLVFAVLFGYFWIYQKDKKAPASDVPESTAPETFQLTQYKVEDLSEVSWKSASYSALLKNPGDQKWKAVSPAVVVDEAKAKSYVESLISLTGSRKYSSKELSAADAGLNSPYLTITVRKKDGSSQNIVIGSKTVDGDYYYARADGSDTITLLSSFVVEDLNKDPYTLKIEPSLSPTPSGTAQF